MEIFTGRSVSYAKHLGGRRGPLAFGSRYEVFEKTTNTLADRTRPAIWLVGKSNAYGSGLFFLLDTERVVARDQWKSMPMDAGTINLLNRVAEQGPALPKNLAMIYKGSEVEDINLEGVEGSIENENTRSFKIWEHPCLTQLTSLRSNYRPITMTLSSRLKNSSYPLTRCSNWSRSYRELNTRRERKIQRQRLGVNACQQPPLRRRMGLSPPSGIARSRKPLAT
jgi:hypothetical protein